MRSKDKCVPKYEGLWDAFLRSGARYAGVLTERELMTEYRTSRVMIDISYAERFASYGCHYNRSIVEALNHGCVPLMNAEAMSGSDIFPMSTYGYISEEYTKDPKLFAMNIDANINMDPNLAERIIFEGRKVLSANFDYRHTCLQYLEAIQG